MSHALDLSVTTSLTSPAESWINISIIFHIHHAVVVNLLGKSEIILFLMISVYSSARWQQFNGLN